jgi:hypothetical protein
MLLRGWMCSQLRMRFIFEENYQKHGIRYFFRGIAPTLLRAVPVNAVTLYVWEVLRIKLGMQYGNLEINVSCMHNLPFHSLPIFEKCIHLHMHSTACARLDCSRMVLIFY